MIFTHRSPHIPLEKQRARDDSDEHLEIVRQVPRLDHAAEFTCTIVALCVGLVAPVVVLVGARVVPELAPARPKDPSFQCRVHDFECKIHDFQHKIRRFNTQSIIVNAKSMIFNTKSVICTRKSIILNTNLAPWCIRVGPSLCDISVLHALALADRVKRYQMYHC